MQIINELRTAFEPINCVKNILFSYEDPDPETNEVIKPKKIKASNRVEPFKKVFDADLSTALRGIKTFNVLKAIVLGCALSKGSRKEANLVDIDILKTLLKELQVLLDHASLTKEVDVSSIQGFDDYSKNDDDEAIQKILKKAVLINPK